MKRVYAFLAGLAILPAAAVAQAGTCMWGGLSFSQGAVICISPTASGECKSDGSWSFNNLKPPDPNQPTFCSGAYPFPIHQ
jgi:hypothetical protein